MDALLSMGASNLVLSTALALAAWIVHRRARRPWLAHLLWVLVLVELVTPPVFNAPLLRVGGEDAPTTEHLLALVDAAGRTDVAAAGTVHSATLPSDAAKAEVTTSFGAALGPWLVRVWVLGSLLVLVVGVVRVVRFDRALRRSRRPADARIGTVANELAARFGLRRTPRTCVVDADVSPFVWGAAGRALVVVPRSLVERLDERALRMVLAHEFAHVRRRDHLVRWLEWAALVAFWWNPVLWFARRGLRDVEELCCDALVVERLATTPKTYARALLDAIELLARPALRPPLVASPMTTGGTLEKRLTMIVSDRFLGAPSRLTRALAALAAAIVLPLGIASAQAPDYDAVGARLVEAVEKGELTADQAKAMFGALAEKHLEGRLAANAHASEKFVDAMVYDAEVHDAIVEDALLHDALVVDALSAEQKAALGEEKRYIAELVAEGLMTKEAARDHLAAVEARMRAFTTEEQLKIQDARGRADIEAELEKIRRARVLSADDYRALQIQLLEAEAELLGIEVEHLDEKVRARDAEPIGHGGVLLEDAASGDEAIARKLRSIGYVLEFADVRETGEIVEWSSVDEWGTIDIEASVLEGIGYIEWPEAVEGIEVIEGVEVLEGTEANEVVETAEEVREQHARGSESKPIVREQRR